MSKQGGHLFIGQSFCEKIDDEQSLRAICQITCHPSTQYTPHIPQGIWYLNDGYPFLWKFQNLKATHLSWYWPQVSAPHWGSSQFKCDSVIFVRCKRGHFKWNRNFNYSCGIHGYGGGWMRRGGVREDVHSRRMNKDHASLMHLAWFEKSTWGQTWFN